MWCAVVTPVDSRSRRRRFFDRLTGRHLHPGVNRYNYGYGYVLRVTCADHEWAQCAICLATWNVKYRPQVVIGKVG